MALRIGFGFDQPDEGDPGLFIYDDVTGDVIASTTNDPSREEKQRLSDALIVADPEEIERFRDSRRYIRVRDNVLLDRHGNEYGPADSSTNSNSPRP